MLTRARFVSQASKCTTSSRTKSTVPKTREMSAGSQDIPFGRAKVGTFFQTEPSLQNVYTGDAFLKSLLARHIPNDVFSKIEGDLVKFGEKCATEINELGHECERYPPTLQSYNAWGKKVDDIVTCSAWKKMKEISAKEGLIAIAYERQFGEFSRLYQLSKLYLYTRSSGLYTCPLAMTDGAAKTIESLKLHNLKDPYTRLTSRDPALFWTSGQWMTEKRGGSDVGDGTETVAVAKGDGSYRLYGYKWFTSATDADMTLTLARVTDSDGSVIPGSKGLDMFFLRTRDDNDRINSDIQVIRLKNKLGTKQLPTAELLLDGVKAEKVSEDGRGVASIANMLTITRLHNGINSVGNMRRLLMLARDYATKRKAFGRLLHEHPLHVQTLSRMEVEVRGGVALWVDLALRLGREELQTATEDDRLILRLMMPVLKLYTAKQGMEVCSEGLESFGGQGYMEDTNLPVIFRDAQVGPIWEGTTNILSLDVLRAVAKTNGEVLKAFSRTVDKLIVGAKGSKELASSAESVGIALKNLTSFVVANQDKMQIAARDFSYSLARIYIGALLLDHAASSSATKVDTYVTNRWCEKDLVPVIKNGSSAHYTSNKQDLDLVMDGYSSKL